MIEVLFVPINCSTVCLFLLPFFIDYFCYFYLCTSPGWFYYFRLYGVLHYLKLYLLFIPYCCYTFRSHFYGVYFSLKDHCKVWQFIAVKQKFVHFYDILLLCQHLLHHPLFYYHLCISTVLVKPCMDTCFESLISSFLEHYSDLHVGFFPKLYVLMPNVPQQEIWLRSWIFYRARIWIPCLVDQNCKRFFPHIYIVYCHQTRTIWKSTSLCPSNIKGHFL